MGRLREWVTSGWLADDLAADSAELEAEGLPVFHTGSSGPVSARWHDGREHLGHHIEILGRTPELEGFYGLIRSSSVGWDGSQPLRPPGRKLMRAAQTKAN